NQRTGQVSHYTQRLKLADVYQLPIIHGVIQAFQNQAHALGQLSGNVQGNVAINARDDLKQMAVAGQTGRKSGRLHFAISTRAAPSFFKGSRSISLVAAGRVSEP